MRDQQSLMNFVLLEKRMKQLALFARSAEVLFQLATIISMSCFSASLDVIVLVEYLLVRLCRQVSNCSDSQKKKDTF